MCVAYVCVRERERERKRIREGRDEGGGRREEKRGREGGKESEIKSV